MSTENLITFSRLLSEDVTLQAEISRARTAKELTENAVRLGAARGLSFTADEFDAQLRRVRTGELTDDELEAVSGGFAALSNLANMRHEMLKSVVQNLRG